MKYLRFTLLFLMISTVFAGAVSAQTTSITLPTNDDTSAFEVKQEDGTTVIQAAGDGNVTVGGTLNVQNVDGDVAVDGSLTSSGPVNAASFVGDGSTLSNVLPIMAVTQGNQAFYIEAGYGEYKNIRSVTITVPARGMIWVNATGFLDWESKETDIFRGAILMGPGDPNTDWYTENDMYSYHCIATDYACADSSDQYAPLAMSRVFSVNSGGTYTFNIWADNPWSTSRTRVHDICMTAMYFPTGGVGAGKAVLPMDTPSATVPRRDTIDGN